MDERFRIWRNPMTLTSTCGLACGAVAIASVTASTFLLIVAAILMLVGSGLALLASRRARIADRAVALVTLRLTEAAQGDLSSRTSSPVDDVFPDLARALDDLVTQVRADIDTVQSMAMYDPVTSLANRATFRREAERALLASPNDPMAIIFIDLDRFKTVNDTFGHAPGDQLLGMVGNRIRTSVRSETARLSDAARDWIVGAACGR